MSDFSPRRILIIYAISIVTLFVSISCVVIAYFLEIQDLIYFHLVSALLYILTAFIAKKGNLELSRLLYFIILISGIVTTASYIGEDGGVEFMLMYAIALPFLTFSFKREKHYIAIFTLLPIIFWVLLYITDFNLITSFKIEKEISETVIYPISIIATLSLVTFQLMHFSYQNAQHFSTIHYNKDEALEASTAKSKFLSTMSHEIRTPLNAVIGLSHILNDNNPRKDQIENIEALNYSGKILLNLLNNVLDFSKMQSTKIELDEIPTDLSQAVKQIQKIHENSCLKKGIKMDLLIDDTLPSVWLDIVRFNQVINNLVANAIKFTKEGKVTLKIEKLKQTEKTISLKTTITDTGIGIPADKLKTIWQPFAQASVDTNRLYGGTGLGLPIVKNIVNAMNSDVIIESKVGKGSQFYFILSLKIASTVSSKEKDKKAHNFDGKKVLMVEDNLINVMVGKQILEKVNLKVEVANNGLEAVNKIKANSYDVVLMDIQMPIMDGYTATKEIRKFNSEIPILALSASVFMEVKDKIEDCGMNGFIFKPFEPQDLLNQINEVVN